MFTILMCNEAFVSTRATIAKTIYVKRDIISLAIKEKITNIDVVSLTSDVWTETTNIQSLV